MLLMTNVKFFWVTPSVWFALYKWEVTVPIVTICLMWNSVMLFLVSKNQNIFKLHVPMGLTTVSLLVLNKFKWVRNFCLLLNLENLWLFADFWDSTSWSICLNSLNIRTKLICLNWLYVTTWQQFQSISLWVIICGYFFAFSSKYLWLNINQYYPKTFFPENFLWKKYLLKNSAISIFSKLV